MNCRRFSNGSPSTRRQFRASKKHPACAAAALASSVRAFPYGCWWKPGMPAHPKRICRHRFRLCGRRTWTKPGHIMRLIRRKLSGKYLKTSKCNNYGRVVTFDRRDYYRLHQNNPNHAGIIACTYDADSHALAARIDNGIRSENVILS